MNTYRPNLNSIGANLKVHFYSTDILDFALSWISGTGTITNTSDSNIITMAGYSLTGDDTGKYILVGGEYVFIETIISTTQATVNKNLVLANTNSTYQLGVVDNWNSNVGTAFIGYFNSSYKCFVSKKPFKEIYGIKIDNSKIAKLTMLVADSPFAGKSSYMIGFNTLNYASPNLILITNASDSSVGYNTGGQGIDFHLSGSTISLIQQSTSGGWYSGNYNAIARVNSAVFERSIVGFFNSTFHGVKAGGLKFDIISRSSSTTSGTWILVNGGTQLEYIIGRRNGLTQTCKGDIYEICFFLSYSEESVQKLEEYLNRNKL